MLNATVVNALRAGLALSIALTAGANAASPQPAESFGDRVLNGLAGPTPAAYHVRTKRLLVGAGGEVRATALDGGVLALDGAGAQAVPTETILRIRVDGRRDRLWILDTGAVHVFDLAKNRRLGKVTLPGWFYAGHSANCLPDLQLDAGGAAFVSDSMQPKLWRIASENFAVSVRGVALDPATAVDAGFSALAVGDAGTIFAAMAAPGFLWRIDTRHFHAQRVALTEPLRGACAMEATRSASSRQLTLFALTAGRGSFNVRRVAMERPWSSGRVSDVVPGSIVAPAGLVTAEGALQLVLRETTGKEPRVDSAAFMLKRIHKLD